MPELRLAPGVEDLSLEGFYAHLGGTPLADCLPWFRRIEADRLGPAGHGDLPRWRKRVRELPKLGSTGTDLGSAAVSVGNPDDCDPAAREQIRQSLQGLHPWRKGPFSIHGVRIDAEWRSDWKWRRLESRIHPLAGRTVLDVGCGNGYYGWRMLGAGADLVLGIDPGILYNLQFRAIRHFIGDLAFGVLPLALEDLPPKLRCFDTVFSMGVLYHRRSPLDHLLELRDCLRPGGELVLETLVIEGDGNRVLVPEDRYARMRNVWFLPSCDTLMGWLKRCGYQGTELADVTTTSSEEQRRTEWMRFQSLADFLMPGDPSLTVEGLPAPRRAIFIARSP